jgi:hypothetical protein
MRLNKTFFTNKLESPGPHTKAISAHRKYGVNPLRMATTTKVPLRDGHDLRNPGQMQT